MGRKASENASAKVRFDMGSIYTNNPPVVNRVASAQEFAEPMRLFPIFGPASDTNTMGHDHDHHDHSEAEQNEIGGPVVLALFLFGLVITVIYFLS